jgi:23S rRNA (uracil1939-C5)-methyltransferase
MTRQWQERRSGQLVELLVERVGAQGDGIAQYQGEPIFLPFSAPGDRVRARLGTRRGPGQEGWVIDRLATGPGRVKPRCRHFGTCGGCALQHLDTASYRAAKLGALEAALDRVGIDPAIVGPLRVVPPARRRVRLGLMRPRDPALPVRLGYRERFRHHIVDIAECPVLEPALFAVLDKLRLAARDLLRPGATAEASLTRTDSGIDLLIEATEPPLLGALEALAGYAGECDLARVVWRSQGREIPVVERRPVRVLMSGVAVPFPPGGFLQASQAAEIILVREGPVRRWFPPSGARSLRRARRLCFRLGPSRPGPRRRGRRARRRRPHPRRRGPPTGHGRTARPGAKPASARTAYRLRGGGV